MYLLPITDVDKEIVAQFSCLFTEYSSEQEMLRIDHEKIDYFIKEKAIYHHLNQLVRTYILLEERKNKIIGFFSLYNEEIAISNGQKKSFKFKGIVLYHSDDVEVYPAIRLHKFALDNEYQGRFFDGQKYSEFLLGEVFQAVRQVAEKSGCTFIGLEATDNSIRFYEEHEFKILRKKNGNSLPFLIFKVADLIS